MKKKRYSIIAIALGLVAISALAELELRLLNSYETWEERNAGKYVSPYDPDRTSWSGLRRPDATYTLSQPEFDFIIKTNSLGLRDIEHPVRKKNNEIRIVVLGDSLVEGQGADFNDSWPRVLLKKLNSGPGKKQFRIVMGGVAGSDPFISQRILKSRLIKYRPDIVFLALNSFDVTDVASRGGSERFDKTAVPKTGPWWEPVFAKSRLFRFIMIRVFNYDWLLLSPEKSRRVMAESRRRMLEMILDLKALGEKKGFSPAVVLQPHVKEAESGKYLNGLDDLGEELERAGIPVLDILPCFSAAAGVPSKYYWERDYHPNSLGYEIFAACVKEAAMQRFPQLLRQAPEQGSQLH